MLGYVQRLNSKSLSKHLILTLVILGAIFFLFQYELLFPKHENLWISQHPIIIWWTPFIHENKVIECTRNKHKCLLTTNRKYINNKNLQAFLFYGSRFDVTDLPVPKNKTWAIFHEESPRNLAVFLYNRTFDLFDIKATFSRRSDFPLTLQYLQTSLFQDTRYVVPVREKNDLLTSIAPVLYIQSDCDTPLLRDEYVRQLMKYIQVDSYGKCLHNKEFPEAMRSVDHLDLYNTELLKFIARYKFVIAFENAECHDYITEKLWRPLTVGSIPIYMGSPSVKDWLPNKNSAILAEDFVSVEELAIHVKKINADDRLYESFLGHKRGKIANDFLKNALERNQLGVGRYQELIPDFECFVCRSVHEGWVKGDGSVYDCLEPHKKSNWDQFWKVGDCESKKLVNFVKNNVRGKDVC